MATSTILLTLALLMGSVSGTEVPTSQVPLPVWPSGVPGVTLDLPSSPPDSCNIDSTDEALVGPPPQVDPAAQELPVGPPSLDDDNPRRPARKAPTQTTPTQVIRWCISETANVRSAPAADRRLPRASQSELELTDLQIVHGPPTNAIVTSNAPDPELFHENGTWYLYTTGTRGRDVALYVSSDQLSWRSGGNALDLSNTEMWYQRGRTWAPAVERFGDTYVMYFTARVTTSDRQCIGAATSKTPLGPFRPNGALPMVCDTDGGSIDASVFTDASGDRYLLWKNDGNSAFGSGTTVLYSRKLNADGLGFSAEPARELARNSPNSWEAANPFYSLVEQPEMVQIGSTYHLFYSGNQYNSANYGVGHALCDGPQGPCRKTSLTAPWLATYDQVYGPGALSIAVDSDGRLMAAFHAWPEPIFNVADGGHRQIYLAELTFDGATPQLISFNTGL